MNKQTQGRLILLAIAAAFALPIFAAVYLYFSDAGWRPGQNTQYGTLVLPPIGLSDAAIDSATPPAAFREVWSMVVVNQGACAEQCQASLVKIRQIRLALGPKMTRMQTVFVDSDGTPMSPELSAQHPRLISASAVMAAEVTAALGDYNTGEIFLVDPFGNLMMRYPGDAEMGGIRDDLAQLLKLSTIG